MVRADTNTSESGKDKGRGLAAFSNIKWSCPGHITVKECICSPHVELLTARLHPHYIPKEFLHASVVVVYIPLC